MSQPSPHSEKETQISQPDHSVMLTQIPPQSNLRIESDTVDSTKVSHHTESDSDNFKIATDSVDKDAAGDARGDALEDAADGILEDATAPAGIPRELGKLPGSEGYAQDQEVIADLSQGPPCDADLSQGPPRDATPDDFSDRIGDPPAMPRNNLHFGGLPVYTERYGEPVYRTSNVRGGDSDSDDDGPPTPRFRWIGRRPTYDDVLADVLGNSNPLLRAQLTEGWMRRTGGSDATAPHERDQVGFLSCGRFGYALTRMS